MLNINKLNTNPQFNWLQMEQIRESFKNNLTIEQVKLFAKPKFNSRQMEQICLGFNNGLTIEQVRLYTDCKFDCNQMWRIREFILENKNTSINILKFLIQLKVL